MQANTPDRNVDCGHDREVQPEEIDEVVNSFIENSRSLAQALDAPDEVLSSFIDSAEDLAQLVGDSAHTTEQNSDEIEELESELNEERERRSAEIEGVHNRLSSEIEELDEGDGSACSQGGEADNSEDNPHTSDEETTALERVCALPESVVEDNLTRNQSRARSIARRIDEYGRKVPAGIAIPSSRIKRVLTAQEDSTIHRQTVARVADFLKQFGDGDVKIKKTRSGEKTVVFTESLVDAVTAVVTRNEGDPVTQAVV